MIASSFQYITRTVVLLSSVFFINLAIVFISTEAYANHNTINKEIFTSLDWKNLLHYNGEKSVINKDSDFFLSSDGFYNPEAEFKTTLEEFYRPAQLNNNHAICRYPARFDYILRSLKLSKNSFPSPICSEYQKYEEKVVFDKVYVVFAAENNLVPSSMMGHTFLRIDGNTRSHAFSYFATFTNTTTLKFYADIIRGIDGAYMLSPYKNKSAEYLHQEGRSIWEFELDLTAEEKSKLKKHLWELKEKKINYSLVSHNCSTALINILKVANSELSTKNIKPYITPIEYIQTLQENNKVSNISIEPSESHKKAIEKFGLNYIANATKPANISISQDINNNLTKINFNPVYQDIRNISDAYFPELESKILDISIDYNNDKQRFIVNNINILKMASIIDYQSTNNLSKYLRIGFENDLFSEKNELKPVFEIGLGIGKKIAHTTVYVLPKMGYHYDKFSNLYIAPQIGAISRLGNKTKMINIYEKYFNSKNNNRGYNGKYTFYTGYQILKNTEVYFDYSHYDNATNSKSLLFGVSVHF